MNTEAVESAVTDGVVETETPTEYVTSGGITLKLRAVSQTLIAQLGRSITRRWREQGKVVDPPTYTVPLAGGGEEIYPHDETTLEVLDNAEETARNRALWAAYRRTASELAEEVNDRTTVLLIGRGVVYEPPKDWEEHLAVQEEYGVVIPQNPVDRRVHYIMTEVLVTVKDLMEVQMRIARLSAGGLNDELLEAVEDSFRRATQSSRRQEVAGPGNTDEGSGEVEHEPPGAGTSGGAAGLPQDAA